MRLVICFNDVRSGEIFMKKRGRIIDQLAFHLDRNLERVLIDSIDKILERNKINLFTLKIIKLGGKLDRQSLAYQLVSSFKKALKL